MPKVLSQSGISLSDTYDVEGSIAGIESLETRDVSLVHEMGATIFSERFSATSRRRETGAVAQNIEFSMNFTNLPTVPFVLRAISVRIDTVARLSRFAVMVRDPTPGVSQEQPIWIWDETNSVDVRFVDDDTVGVYTILRPFPAFDYLPMYMVGNQAPKAVPDVIGRGLTTGFGAGTVELSMLLYLQFAEIVGISSHGLPVPSW